MSAYITKFQPEEVVLPGSSVHLHVEANGTAPLNYQWKKNGVNINNANGKELNLTNLNKQIQETIQ